MTDGFLCGWRVQSELRLPELAPWSGDDRPPDIVIRFGSVADRLDDVVHARRALQIDRDGTCLLRVRNIAAYLVRSGEVTIEPQPDAEEAAIRVYLLGSVFGFLCHQHGLFPLHASCVAIGGMAAAMCGPTGAGKSTTATHLAMRGHRLVADDVCVIDAHAAGGPLVLPAFPRLKLTRDALAALEISTEGFERDRLGELEKYHYTPTESFTDAAVPLGGIFLLHRAEPGTREECVRLSRPAEKIAMLSKKVFRPQAAAALRSAQSLLAAQAAIAAAVPIWRIARHFDLADMDRWLRQIEALVGP
jgi:HPr Serine kinase C-terminal domain